MKYRSSQIDIKLKRWFENSLDHQLLRKISLTLGRLRGVTKFEININYPLLAIAGRNGSGKSTILAMAACAYHNDNKEYLLKNRRKPYYTFADFFIQHSDETPPEGIRINYKIAYNNWLKSERFPDGTGIGNQARHKKNGGKWNRYDRRVSREVIYLGIERIVPHIEKSQSRSYSKSFSEDNLNGWESTVKDIVGYILNKKYDNFKFVTHSKYRLPLIEIKGRLISGFNMGAGENALFEIFSVMFSCKEGALIVIDEIELGLHCEAQSRLLKKMKEVSLQRKLQIIFTTHSDTVFECLPDEARVFIETISDATEISMGISSEYAFSKLSSDNSEELDIFVEDGVAKSLILSLLPARMRCRVNIDIIGSASALSRQLAAIYNRTKRKKTLVIFDGDQRAKQNHNLKHAKDMAENVGDDFDSWFLSKINYLPGNIWPEKWLVQKNIEFSNDFALVSKSDIGLVEDALERGLESEKHKEVYNIATQLGLSPEETLSRLCINIAMNCNSDFSYIVDAIQEQLDK
ncbi:ATP-binding protein [Yersinia enterocolitica]|nr:ATP-binding protein [Yersinia enterocolitica]EKN3722419.1 ATP-binding protein [Yersinia enterocolitica]EKN4080016.1 ATP-binding protein [Yersinia enterocolitica]EKN4147912.1 ATP-binding protein [Yersinia enterocolitica]EKN6086331.1 ATP-binding protein [Yersinia enterocolitica]